MIDPEALRRWLSLPIDGDVTLRIKRDDVDNLLLGLRQLLITQGDAMAAFQFWAIGNQDEANASHQAAMASHLKAWNSITKLTSAIMAKAEVSE